MNLYLHLNIIPAVPFFRMGNSRWVPVADLCQRMDEGLGPRGAVIRDALYPTVTTG